MLRTEVVPATGTFIDMFDLYGNRYWYDLRTERITFNADELREEPAAATIQRIFRGHQYRKNLYAEHFAAGASVSRTHRMCTVPILSHMFSFSLLCFSH